MTSLIASSGKSYACFGCVQWAYNQRTLAYHRWACSQGMYPEGCVPDLVGLCGCPDDDDEVFTDPATDQVCWYDPNVPESIEFLGVIILSAAGLKSSTFSREATDSFLEGSVLQRPRRRGKSIAFEVLLLATSCEGMNYGREWLRGVFEDNSACGVSSCASCAGSELTLRTSCPDGDAADDGLHVWHSVGLIDGYTPTEGSGRGYCCCVLERGTFSVQAESPYSFSLDGVEECALDADPDAYVRCYDWMTDCIECQEDCCDKCGFDALCTCFPALPVEPEVLNDNCFCEPLAKIIQCCCVDDIPGGYDSTFKIDIYSGTDWSNEAFKLYGLRDYRLKIYDNPTGLPCITDDESYQAWCERTTPCIELKIAYIPENSTLTIDGRTGKITLNCNGRCIPFSHVVTSSEGSIFPLIANCLPIMICSEFSYYGSQVMPAGDGIAPSSIAVSRYLRFRN